jgi:hypothetical protein
MNEAKALVDAPSTVRRDRTEGGRTRRDDDNLPWWLVLIPAALVTMIFFVTALAFLMGAPWTSDSSDSKAEAQVDLPGLDDTEISRTTPSTPAFSR